MGCVWRAIALGFVKMLMLLKINLWPFLAPPPPLSVSDVEVMFPFVKFNQQDLKHQSKINNDR